MLASGEYGVLFACGIDFQEEKAKTKESGEAQSNDRAFKKAYAKIVARARGNINATPCNI